MKLPLFDENLSRRLVARLADVFPGFGHIVDLGMESAPDIEVWEYARVNGYVITTKDSDFNELGLVSGFPPKVVWIRCGNCSTRDDAVLSRASYRLPNNVCRRRLMAQQFGGLMGASSHSPRQKQVLGGSL